MDSLLCLLHFHVIQTKKRFFVHAISSENFSCVLRNLGSLSEKFGNSFPSPDDRCYVDKWKNRKETKKSWESIQDTYILKLLGFTQIQKLGYFWNRNNNNVFTKKRKLAWLDFVNYMRLANILFGGVVNFLPR